MGVYSNNRFAFNEGYGSFVEDVEPDLSYFGQAGADRILAEAAQNDLKMFDAIIANDFQEAYLTKAMNEGADYADQIVALQEASASGIFGRLKEFLKKIWAKIKGLIESFLTKIRGAVTSDNKKLVDKFKKQITSNSSKLSKMKFKWSKPTGKEMDYSEAIYKTKAEDKVIYIMGVNSFDAMSANTHHTLQVAADRCYELEKEIGDEDYDDKQLSELSGISNTSVADFTKDAHEFFFEDEDEEDGTFGSLMTSIMSMLINSKDFIKSLEKAQQNIDKYFREQIKRAQKMEDVALKAVGREKDSDYKIGTIKADGTKGGGDKINNAGNGGAAVGKILNYNGSEITAAMLMAKIGSNLQQYFSHLQTNITKCANADMAACQFHIKQCRRVWIQAASFAVKPVKEDAMLFDAIGESADFETDQLIGY